MKLLVFAHTPPPHHGQSYMVQMLLNALGGDVRQALASSPAKNNLPGSRDASIECYHLNSRLSKDAEDIGQVRMGKLFLALCYCLQAIGWRFRYHLTHFYYIPAFPKRAPIYRDWIVLGLCRPFFKKIIFHWHTVGLAEWLDTQAKPWERWLSRQVYKRPDLSIILRSSNGADARAVASKTIQIVPNGIPDPCPQFQSQVLPRRLARQDARKKILADPPAPSQRKVCGEARIFRVLFLSLCYSGKGLFDTVEAVAQANQRLKTTPVRIRLTVAGEFWLRTEKEQFETRILQPDLLDDGPVVDYHGFVGGSDKGRLFLESDCLCFPTRMAECAPLVLVESMAYGLPLITTQWRNIPEMLPPAYPGVVEPQAPDQIADKLLELIRADYDPSLRACFLQNYTDARFSERIKTALSSV